MIKKIDQEEFTKRLRQHSQRQDEFHQAVDEVLSDIIPIVNANKEYLEANILERLTEPDRTITFRVTWEDDKGVAQINRGYRVQFNNSIGPYKGGLRFHPTVRIGILKFLAFEQIFKNSLTGLPMGGAKGGANFDRRGKSDREIMRFCQAFMTELAPYIGPDIDIPAGDIGVGAKEIGYMFGQYKRIRNTFTGTMTGKSLSTGGSQIRREATGYGLIYFLHEMLEYNKLGLAGKTCLISGAGNVALYAAEKAMELGAKVLTLSDSEGFISFGSEGLNSENFGKIRHLKEDNRERLAQIAKKLRLEYHKGKKPWGVKADFALPCATENELDGDDLATLVKNGCQAIAEGANMPLTAKAVALVRESPIVYGPGKASNAGGVAVSGLEMSQNSMRISWTITEMDLKLKNIMKSIHHKCVEHGGEKTRINYIKGANIAGFLKVADAMLSYGVV